MSKGTLFRSEFKGSTRLVEPSRDGNQPSEFSTRSCSWHDLDAKYNGPRSRSPTPAADDDYFIVPSDPGQYATTHYDPEKGVSTMDRQYALSYPLPVDPGQITPASIYPDTPLTTRHFGPAPTGRVLRRHKTKKRVRLTKGNLVVDLPVPPKLFLPRRGEPEMMQTRYTAVTCDPDDFEKSNFFLRQNESGRKTEMFIVITMYNVRRPILPCAHSF